MANEIRKIDSSEVLERPSIESQESAPIEVSAKLQNNKTAEIPQNSEPDEEVVDGEPIELVQKPQHTILKPDGAATTGEVVSLKEYQQRLNNMITEDIEEDGAIQEAVEQMYSDIDQMNKAA